MSVKKKERMKKSTEPFTVKFYKSLPQAKREFVKDKRFYNALKTAMDKPETWAEIALSDRGTASSKQTFEARIAEIENSTPNFRFEIATRNKNIFVRALRIK